MEIEALYGILPPSLVALLSSVAYGPSIAELRLRRGKRASLSVYREGRIENIALSYVASGEEMERVLAAVCGDSVYAHEESIKRGYVRMKNGWRVGVAGEAVTEKGSIARLFSVGSLVFRLHRRIKGAADGLLSAFREGACAKSILVYGPPCCGKTTVLREFAREISRGKGALRAVLADARGEFGEFEEDCLLDILKGYPTGEGVEIALRTLSPQVLILDEIGKEEALSLAYAVGSGVPIVASAHASSAEELLMREGLSSLLKDGVFPLLYPLTCKQGALTPPWGGV